MVTVRHIKKIALITGAFFLCIMPGFSQDRILELLPGSDKLGYDAKTGAHRLVGSVNFIYQGNTMYCDSAHYFDKTQEVRAYGNVHITKEDINLFCDSLYYHGKTKRAKLWGHVRVRDLEYKLTTDTLEYDAKKGQGIYRHGGKIESITSNEVLTSRVGYFYPETKSFFFSGKVRYKNDDLSMSTDTLQYIYSKQTTYFYGPTNIKKGETNMFCERGWYNIDTEEGSLIKNARVQENNRIIEGDTLLRIPKEELSIAKGNVMFLDTSAHQVLRGNYGKLSEHNHSAFMTGNASAASFKGKDTLYVFADTLYNQNDTLDKPLFTKAFRNVKFYNTNLQGIADSVFFSQKDGIAELYKDPVVWSENVELKGDSVTVYLKDSIIEKIHIRQNSTVLMEIDSGLYYNQISGKEIIAMFNKNELYRTDVAGSAITIFYPEDTEKTDSSVFVKRKGMNRLSSGELRIYVDSGDVTGITYFEQPDGVFYPMSDIPEEDMFIKNFNWKEALRPKKRLIEGILPD